MARELYDQSIDKHTDWGGDASTENKPVTGNRVQEFIKNQLEMKAGCFYYDSNNQRYLVFADEENRDLYISDPQTYSTLLIATFDAPSEYSASITLLSPSNVAILSGTTGNRIRYTFDIVNRSGASVGDNVNVTYTFKRGSRTQQFHARYSYGASVDVNIDDYLLDGTNTITIALTGVNTLAATTYAITYKVINLSLTDSFDISEKYGTSGTLHIPYSVSGSGTKELEWYIDGTKKAKVASEDEIVNTEYSGTKFISFSGLSTGVHHLQFRCKVIEGEEPFYSNWLYREFIVHSGSSTTPIVAIAGRVIDGSTTPVASGQRLQLTDLTQYVPYDLTFAVYNPASGQSTTSVQILLDGISQTTLTATNEVVSHHTLTPMTDGEHTLTIKAGSNNSVVTIVVAETSMDIHEITNNLILDFNAAGKSNESASDTRSSQTIAGKDTTGASHNYTATFSNFDWNALSGWSDNRLVISAGASLRINAKPLSWAVKDDGLTIEMEYATTNVSDDDTVICNMISNSIGLKLTASEASLSNSIWIANADNEKKALKTRYKSGELNRIVFVINPFANATNHGLVFIYINGRLSGAKAYSSDSSFENNNDLLIQGSASASVIIKQIRIYNRALSSDEVYNNYVLYRDTLQEMMQVYDHNDIYNADGTALDPDKLASAMPVMLFTGDIPALENEYSDKKKQIVVDVIYNNLQDPSKSFTLTNATLTPQGTSSMAYPKKNFRLYTRKYTQAVLKDSDGNVVADGLYSFKDGAQPVACWCLKADYAESSSSHNTGLARLWNKLLYDAKVTYDASETSSSTNSVSNDYALRTEAQKSALENDYGYDVRTCVDGFPIMCFYRPNEDSDYIFIGKYNFNNDKSTESVFGFCDIPGFDDTNMQCWECLDNSNSISLFTNLTNFDSSWDEAFESRYPDTPNPPGLSQLKTFALWVNGSTAGSTAFSTQKWAHIDVYKMAAYYVYLMVFGAVDQTTKNSMLTSEDGAHYYYINYDNDTILGVRNDGILAFPPTIDRQSLDESYQGITAYAYAGHDNKLWNCLEADDEFMSIVRAVYDALYGVGLTYATLIDMFDTKQSLAWCERVANLDSDYKYLSPYRSAAGTDHLEMLQGARSAHRRWWLSKRLALYDAKFVSGSYKSNIFQFKVATGTPANISFSIVAGTELYYGYGINSAVVSSGVHLSANEPNTWTIARQLSIGDPVSIYAGIYLKEVDISNFFNYLTNIEMSTVYSEETDTTNLVKLVLGKSSGTNTSLTALSGLSAAKKLEYLDIQGFKGLTALDLTANKYVKTLKAKRSNIAQIDLADGSVITTLEVPTSLSSLRLINCPNITPSGISFEDTYGCNIKTIDIRGCKKAAMKQYSWSLIWDWYQHKTVSNSQCSVYIDNIAWTGVSAANLLTFGQGLSQGSLTLKGKITLSDTDLTSQQISDLRTTFGEHCFDSGNDLTIQTLQDIIVLEGPSEITEGSSEQYHLTVISTKTGTVSYRLVNISGISGVSLSDNGLLVVSETGATDSFLMIYATFTPTSGSAVEKYINVTVRMLTYPPISAVTLSGPSVLTGATETITATIANLETYTGRNKLDAVWTLSGDIATYFSIRDTSTLTNGNIKKGTGTYTYVSGTLTYKLQYLRNGEVIVIGTKTYNLYAYDSSLIAVLRDLNGPVMTAFWSAYGTNGTKEAGVLTHEDYITKSEAASFTGTMLNPTGGSTSSIFYAQRTNITHFEEFQFFTGITTIPAYCFAGCTNMTSLVLPDTTTVVNSYGLQNCSKLTELNVEHIQTLGTYAMQGCSKIEELYFDSIITLNQHCFRDMSSLRILDISSCRSITHQLSYSGGWPSLEKLIIGNATISRVDTFTYQTTGFTLSFSYDFDNSASTLNAFRGNSNQCVAYYAIEVDETNPYFKVDGGCLIKVSNNSIELTPNSTSWYIPIGAVSIASYAARNKRCPSSLVIPEGFNTINTYAFNAVKNLSYLSLPSTITTFGQYAFSACTSIQEVIFEEGFTAQVQSYSFQNCTSLRKITFPSTITNLLNRSFSGCSNLSEIISYSLSINADWQWRNAFTAWGTASDSSTDWAGYNNRTAGTSVLHVPVNATGYADDSWTQVLLNANRSNFTLVKDL